MDDPIHELIALSKREKGKNNMKKFVWVAVLLVVGYVIGAKYPQFLAKVQG